MRVRYKGNVRKDARAPFPTRWAALLTLAMVGSLSYLWLDGCCGALARDIQKLEKTNGDLRRWVAVEESRWAGLCTLKKVREQLVRRGIAMTWPSEDRVVHMPRVYTLADIEASALSLTEADRAWAREGHE